MLGSLLPTSEGGMWIASIRKFCIDDSGRGNWDTPEHVSLDTRLIQEILVPILGKPTTTHSLRPAWVIQFPRTCTVRFLSIWASMICLSYWGEEGALSGQKKPHLTQNAQEVVLFLSKHLTEGNMEKYGIEWPNFLVKEASTCPVTRRDLVVQK